MFGLNLALLEDKFNLFNATSDILNFYERISATNIFGCFGILKIQNKFCAHIWDYFV